MVAALTIPNLIVNYQKKVFVTKTKYVYNVLSRAVEASIQENGTPDTWNYGSKKQGIGFNKDELQYFVDTYFKPYLKTTKDTTAGLNDYSLLLNNGITLSFFVDGGTDSHGIFTPSVIYIISSFNGNKTGYADISRNYSKNDIFLALGRKYNWKLSFFNWGGNTRNGIKNHGSYGCNEAVPKHKRFGCGALIQFDGWQIKEDYPW